MDRYVIDRYGPDGEALLAALRWLIKQATQRGAEAAIVVPGADRIESLTGVIGSELAVYAKKHRQVTLNGVTVDLVTPPTQVIQATQFAAVLLPPWLPLAHIEDEVVRAA
jgi:hypothetical protein